MNETVIYHCTVGEEPIKLKNPSRFVLTLIFMLEIKHNRWRFSESGHLYMEKDDRYFEEVQEERITYAKLKKIIDVPNYLLFRILDDIKKAGKLDCVGGKTIKEKALCKLNRLVKIASEMWPEDYLKEMEDKVWDEDFVEEMKPQAEGEGYLWEDDDDRKRFFKKHRKEFCQRYEIVGLAELYRAEFPECSRQTMKRDFDVLNETGTVRIDYWKNDADYYVENQWLGPFY